MYKKTSEKLCVTLWGDVWCDMLFLLAMTSQKEELGLVMSNKKDLRLCYEFDMEIPKKDGCVFVKSVDLTAADVQTAEAILSRIMDAADVTDKQKLIADGMEQYKSDKYCKLIQLSCFVYADKLPGVLSDISQGLNELIVCFEMCELVSREVREFNKKYSSKLGALCVRSVGTLMEMIGLDHFKTEHIALKGDFHRIMVNSDALILFEDRYRYNDEQLALVSKYLGMIPAVGFKLNSDLLNEKFEDITDEELIREKYFGTVERRRISCDGIKALYEAVYSMPPLCGIWKEFICCAGATGFDNDNIRLFDVLAAASVGVMTNAFAQFYFIDISKAGEALEACAERTKHRLTAVPEGSRLTPEGLTEFLRSDRPRLSPNGGIATKSHGKLKFPESCRLAQNAYEFLLATIDKADLSYEIKAVLSMGAVHFADAYSGPDGNIIINRRDYVKAAENAKDNTDFSRGILSAFLKTL